MSRYEKEGEQEDRKSLITPSLHLCLCAILECNLRTNQNIFKCVQVEKQRCRDGVINDFLSWYRHLLVSLLAPVMKTHG